MALINCPECGREVSDRAGSCPQCGCPLGNNQKNTPITKRKIKKYFPFFLLGIIILGIALVYYNFFILKPEKELRVKQGIYDEAIIELEKGKYEKGIELLKTISDFGDTATVIEQAKYESYALSSVNAVKAVLKNPDSIIIHEVRFYNDFDEVNDETEKLSIEEQEKETSTEAKKEETFSQYPVVVIHYGAQNGFGGNTPGYAYCQYSEESDKYEIEGLTDELDIDELDKDDENYLLYLFSASKINSYLDTGEEIGDIDEGRFDSVLRNAAYSSIKVIE